MKKRICMVVQNPLVRGGISAVVSGYRESKLEKSFNINYVESYKDGRKLTKLFKGIKGYFHFAKLLLIDKPDLIHVHSSFGASFYRKLPFIYMASWAKKPIINHIHGAEFEPFYLNASNTKKKMVQKVYGMCTVLITLSDEWKEKLSLIIPEEKITVIENYSIIHEDAVEDRKIKSLNKQVLFLGEICKRKGCYDFPDVVEEVVQSIPDVRFILGGCGEVEEIKMLLEERNLQENVEFTGWVRGKDKDTLLRSSDIFFLPSYNEGMPMSILDAMGYGLPIVSTNVGGIPKIVHSEVNGYIINPGDVKCFARAIIELLQDKNKLESYGFGSYKIVKEKYSLDSHLKLIEKLYLARLQ
ncbi:glycosyltransferase family 4 protein [Peribacillus sp. NPDC097198]|uniref:glycosyltransferase family 4 protein n=1 Tax=Peribacillus sp. NPDC097198 TaxID=3364397 RepID=UPI0037FD9261